MKILDTDRLTLRQVSLEDAEFIFRLLNEPSWLQYIGDKNVRNLNDAETYIRNVLMKMYSQHGFGLFLVEHKTDQTAIGLCGLIKRKELEDVDLGFAFLSKYWGKGYAMEAALAIVDYGRRVHNLSTVVAITLPNNYRSLNLLKKLGFKFKQTIHLGSGSEKLELYSMTL
ncbi:GNAT family N-acetyltransferase [Vacuolonema iberomarrocanum]|uniref:GNAT family N-acetyltransferase n=1 Tax=Vacuolonema iberomarrocanum TaxID=3454632 RepID=UPI0019E42911|nr:GNAT family N-acetyltransferase [filamentous cyanobacterium LEGE 07170]